MKKLFIIILNFNGGQLVLDCLHSLQLIKSAKGWQAKVIVVDNHSTDHSVQQIESEFSRIPIIKNKKNLGFAGGNNLGIKYALKHDADAVLLLNQDTVVEKDFLIPLIKSKADIVGPVIKFKRKEKWLYDFGGRVDFCLGRTKHDERIKIKNEKPGRIDYLSGCCLLVKKKVFEKIGFLDEKFFLYFEDTDFCLRAKKAGFKISVEPKAVVLHKLAEGKKRPLKQKYHLLKSHFIFISRYLVFWRRPLAFIFSFWPAVFIFAFLFAWLVFSTHYALVGSGVWGDGQYYYSYTRSLVVDGDINFENEFKHFSLPIQKTETGLVANKFSLGPGLLWLPFFSLAHFLAKGSGFSHIYQLLTGLGSVFYGILGLWFCFKFVKNYFSEKIALAATLSIWLASNLFFYTAVDPINSHSLSFFLASTIILFWQQIDRQKLSQFAVLGFLIGFLAMIRAQDIIFIGPFLVWSLKDWQKNKKLVFKRALVLLVSAFIGFLPQLLTWQILFGQLKSPYLVLGERFNWLKPQVGAVLLSRSNGLFLYSPILVFSLIGLYFLLKKSHFLALLGFSLFFLEVYLVSSWHSWSGGAAYGGRMFISLMPFYIIGLAGLLEKLKSNRKIICSILFTLVILNFVSIIRFLSNN